MIPKAPPAFSRGEYLRRLAAVKASMAHSGIDILLVTTYESIIYLTGYLAESAYVPQALILTARHAEPDFIVRAIDRTAALHQCFMEPARITSYSDAFIGGSGADGYDFLIDRLLDCRKSSGRVGLELGNLSIDTWEKLRRRISPAGWVDFSGAIERIRWRKSDEEVAVMRASGRVTSAAMMKVVETARPGVRECEVAAAAMQVMACGVDGIAPDFVQAPLICSGPRTGTAHIYWSNSPLERGMQVNVELGAYVSRYATGLMRTLVLGQPSARLQSVHDAEMRGLEACLAAARPGNTCGDVARAFEAEIAKAGLKKDTRCGYSIGINWMEHALSLRRDCETPLERNMTFHLMLGNWLEEDFGYTLSETILITDAGAQCLTTAPRELFRIES
jgi:ectoine hydrolase